MVILVWVFYRIQELILQYPLSILSIQSALISAWILINKPPRLNTFLCPSRSLVYLFLPGFLSQQTDVSFLVLWLPFEFNHWEPWEELGRKREICIIIPPPSEVALACIFSKLLSKQTSLHDFPLPGGGNYSLCPCRPKYGDSYVAINTLFLQYHFCK